MTVKNDSTRLVEFVYWVDPLGNLYPLFGGSRALMSWKDFGMPPLDYLSDRGPNEHGRTVRDYRFRERTVTLEMYERGCQRIDWWCNEADLVDAIRPNRSSTAQPGKLLVILPDNTEREIFARVSRGPSGDWIGTGSQNPYDLGERMQFVCPDPFWRDPTQINNVFTVNISGACLSSCLPFCLGTDAIINVTTDIAYTGTWDGDQITITLVGPMINPIITNNTTSQQIRMNYTIPAGESVTIDILPTLTTVTSNSGDNLIGTIADISDLVTFFLATKSDLTSDGVNSITVNATGGTLASSITFSYYTRHVSIFAPC